jgi:DNA-binding HxlR family transcriptional regulator
MSSEPRTADWNSTTDRPRFVDPNESFEAVHELLGRKWHLRIVYQLLENGDMGFSGLKDGVDGISSKMLSESLSTLEDRGLVVREIVNDQPVRVEYSLTATGRALEATIDALLQWEATHDVTAEA